MGQPRAGCLFLSFSLLTFSSYFLFLLSLLTFSSLLSLSYFLSYFLSFISFFLSLLLSSFLLSLCSFLSSFPAGNRTAKGNTSGIGCVHAAISASRTIGRRRLICVMRSPHSLKSQRRPCARSCCRDPRAALRASFRPAVFGHRVHRSADRPRAWFTPMQIHDYFELCSASRKAAAGPSSTARSTPQKRGTSSSPSRTRCTAEVHPAKASLRCTRSGSVSRS